MESFAKSKKYQWKHIKIEKKIKNANCLWDDSKNFFFAVIQILKSIRDQLSSLGTSCPEIGGELSSVVLGRLVLGRVVLIPYFNLSNKIRTYNEGKPVKTLIYLDIYFSSAYYYEPTRHPATTTIIIL